MHSPRYQYKISWLVKDDKAIHKREPPTLSTHTHAKEFFTPSNKVFFMYSGKIEDERERKLPLVALHNDLHTFMCELNFPNFLSLSLSQMLFRRIFFFSLIISTFSLYIHVFCPSCFLLMSTLISFPDFLSIRST